MILWIGELQRWQFCWGFCLSGHEPFCFLDPNTSWVLNLVGYTFRLKSNSVYNCVLLAQHHILHGQARHHDPLSCSRYSRAFEPCSPFVDHPKWWHLSGLGHREQDPVPASDGIVSISKCSCDSGDPACPQRYLDISMYKSIRDSGRFCSH